MSINNLFSKRNRASKDQPEVYTYDQIPEALRVQVMMLWDNFFPDYDDQADTEKFYASVRKILCQEYGTYQLSNYPKNGAYYEMNDLRTFFGSTNDYMKVLDVIELSFQHLKTTRFVRRGSMRSTNQLYESTVSTLNTRFKEHAVGYEFIESNLVRIDSLYVHEKIVKPALMVLKGARFAGAEKEFYDAHEHYRAGRTEEAMVSAIKSMESTLKCIFDQKRWLYNSTDPFKSLLDVAFKNELIPNYWQNHFSGLRSCLEGGAPTARNKTAGHGQGQEIRDVPDHIAAFTIHSAAAAIVLFVESAKS